MRFEDGKLLQRVKSGGILYKCVLGRARRWGKGDGCHRGGRYGVLVVLTFLALSALRGVWLGCEINCSLDLGFYLWKISSVAGKAYMSANT